MQHIKVKWVKKSLNIVKLAEAGRDNIQKETVCRHRYLGCDR